MLTEWTLSNRHLTGLPSKKVYEAVYFCTRAAKVCRMSSLVNGAANVCAEPFSILQSPGGKRCRGEERSLQWSTSGHKSSTTAGQWPMRPGVQCWLPWRGVLTPGRRSILPLILLPYASQTSGWGTERKKNKTYQHYWAMRYIFLFNYLF